MTSQIVKDRDDFISMEHITKPRHEDCDIREAGRGSLSLSIKTRPDYAVKLDLITQF